MTKTFTQNDVVRYLYNEIPAQEKAQFEDALACNSELVNLFYELSAVKRSLDGAYKNPSDHTLENILDYSKSFNLHPVKK